MPDIEMQVAPHKYHGPGWSIDTEPAEDDKPADWNPATADLFQLWAPNGKRELWAAGWATCSDSGFAEGLNADEVMAQAFARCPRQDRAEQARRLLFAAAMQDGLA